MWVIPALYDLNAVRHGFFEAPSFQLESWHIMMHTLSLGTALLDQLAAAVHAVQDRLQREHNQKEEAHERQSR
jgi:hypothetical protein